jgi:uncharacterized protein (TIGR03435 family)
MQEAARKLPYVAIPEQKLSRTRYPVILFAAFFMSVPMPQAIWAQAATAVGTSPEFEVVTIKPSDPGVLSGTFFTVKGRHVIARSIDLDDLISLAYGVHTKQIVNGPSWLATARFDLDGVPGTEGKPNRAQMKLLFQKLLADRFQFAFHHEMKELSVYTLTADKNGPKLTKTDRLPTDGTNFSYAGSVVLTVRNASMEDFANGMQAAFLDRPVVDQTGLRDRYDFVLRWTPEGSTAGNDPSAPPDIYTAIREQLGLKLNAAKAPVDVLVIDRVKEPSPN